MIGFADTAYGFWQHGWYRPPQRAELGNKLPIPFCILDAGEAVLFSRAMNPETGVMKEFASEGEFIRVLH